LRDPNDLFIPLQGVCFVLVGVHPDKQDIMSFVHQLKTIILRLVFIIKQK